MRLGRNSTWTNTAGSQENLPINCVNWYEAYAFCIWDGGFLPSEAEWEYAAAGGSEQREYPWGTTQPGDGEPVRDLRLLLPERHERAALAWRTSRPWGRRRWERELWGQLDMAGNVWQWNLDWYATYVDPCTDCAYLTAGSYRVVRGAGFFGYLGYVTIPSDLRFRPIAAGTTQRIARASAAPVSAFAAPGFRDGDPRGAKASCKRPGPACRIQTPKVQVPPSARAPHRPTGSRPRRLVYRCPSATAYPACTRPCTLPIEHA